jgi:protein involved in polysaccharide export with SLBB domain
MNGKGWLSALGLIVAAFLWTGCETVTPGKVVVCNADDIRTGDTLIISLLDLPASEVLQDREFNVRSDGTVNLPAIGSMKAAGKKFGEFEREVQSTYINKGIYKQVTVIVKPGLRFYSVGGEVKQPGRQTYSGETTVLRAITTAGDFTEFANRRRVEIIRTDGSREIVDAIKLRKNPQLDRAICPGDYIHVPRTAL